jgi:haloalkane dehalogenase
MLRSEHNDWRKLYPFASQFLSLGGHRFHYVDEGDGQPILMVHGNPTWSFYWRNLILAFRNRFRTIAPDHIGAGLSDKPQRYGYCLRQHVDNLVELIQNLDLREVTLVAHDWGGAIGLGAAVTVPSRFSRFVLFNTGAFPPPFVPLRIRACRTPLLGSWAIRRLNVFARGALVMATENPRRLKGSIAAGLLAPYDSWQHRVGIDRFVRDIPLTPRHATWKTLTEIESRLPQLADRPVQLIWGMRDWCFRRECLDRFQRHFPAAEIHCLPDAGHYVVEDANERVVELVREFLAV